MAQIQHIEKTNNETGNQIDVVGDVLVDENKKIILFKRSKFQQHYPNHYEFPGGKVKHNETTKEALIRELREEINIEVQEEDIIPFENNTRLFKTIRLSLFIVMQWKNIIKINEEIHENMIKIDYSNLNDINNLIQNDKTFINTIQKFMQTEFRDY